jgi:hypothetical protein
VVDQFQNPQGIDLAVVLPFHNGPGLDSRIHLLLNDESLKDVDGFIATRDSPTVIELEAKQLLNNQQEFGVIFDPKQELPVDRMMNMEVRDQGRLPLGQESDGFQ